MAPFTEQRKARDLTGQESAEQRKLLQEETDAKQSLYLAEHSGS